MRSEQRVMRRELSRELSRKFGRIVGGGRTLAAAGCLMGLTACNNPTSNTSITKTTNSNKTIKNKTFPKLCNYIQMF